MTAARASLDIAGTEVRAGTSARIELPIARLTSGTPVALPIVVHHGAASGPTIWLSAAVHGDEIGGVEIIRRVLSGLNANALGGTVIAVPIVNVYGFNTGDRYLPDRRDLNRSFPGSARGSLASRLANLMMREVVERCALGIDLHTGSDMRTNLPQVRCDLDDEKALRLARAFGAPIVLHAKLRDGSLRQAAAEAGSTALVFEGGEADRFDERAIATGAAGVQRVMAEMGMIAAAPASESVTRLARKSRWLRAPRSGILHVRAGLGASVAAGEEIARIVDPFGKVVGRIAARADGVVIGRTQHPLVNQGDAVAHLASIES